MIKEILKNLQEGQASKKQESLTIKPIYPQASVRKTFLQVLMDEVGPDLKIDQENEQAIELICQYMNREPEFIEAGYSFYKGLWLAGKFGTGKTKLIQSYRRAKKIIYKQEVGFKSCVDMNDAFIKVDPDTKKPNGHLGIRVHANKFDQMERIYDDLGEEEPTVQDYGNKYCVMAKILSERYKGLPNAITHITTNLTRQQIIDIYGGRIESRMYEMFNIINVGGSAGAIDYRKNQNK